MAGRGNVLTDQQRAFLVEQIACFATPTEAATALFEEFGIQIKPSAVEKYDFTKQAGKRCAEKWKVLYTETRKAFCKHIAERVPHAEKAYRVRKLAKAADAYEKSKNWVAMANMLEKIAKELGGSYTNRYEHTGKGGGPIEYRAVEQMTDDELDDEIRRHDIDPASIHLGTNTKH